MIKADAENSVLKSWQAKESRAKSQSQSHGQETLRELTAIMR